jgi:hypothetical protein
MRAVFLLVVLATFPVAAQDETRDRSIDRVPAKLRAEIRAVQAEATVHAKLPKRAVRSKAAAFRTLLGRLPQSSRWLRALKLGDYAVADLPDKSFSIDDKSGAKAVCTRALDEEGLLVIVAKGTLDVPVLPSILGTGVIVVRYAPTPNTTGTLSCEAVVDFRLRSGLLHMLSRPFKRTLSQVIVAKLAALIRSAVDLSEAIERDPVAVYRKLEQANADTADLKAFRLRFLRL